ncbi:EAL domain-containing protein [Rhodoferax sp.]|uniref:putative bifunctional diguanylate cyclase/phosphodiesterase n=1 Tax=Rhodoferax sp. TaxID=50421 RepID=UPI00283BA6E7|nr:EAL domain-containing protein [Rhodoferax sp.]MDR3371860.1 EAL domain-containing protein [Rhodoferax sp.]
MASEVVGNSQQAVPTAADFQEQSFADFDRRIGLSFGALLLALLLAALLAGGLFYRSVAAREQETLSALVSQILAKSVNRISFSGKYHARLLLEEIVKTGHGIRYIVLLDRQGFVIAHSDPAKNDILIDSEALAAANTVLAGQEKVVRNLLRDGEAIREITVPYLSGFDNHVSGVIQVGLSDQAQMTASRQGLYFVGALVLLLLSVGVIMTHYISQKFARPVVRLANDLAATLQAIPDLLFEIDEAGRYLKVIARQSDLLVASKEQLLGHTVHESMSAPAAQAIMQALARADISGADYAGEIFLPLQKGEYWFELSVSKKRAVGHERPTFIVVSRDITERKRAQVEINHLAFYDPLTQLPNRRLLQDRLKRAMAAVVRSEKHGALLFIDLDNFKLLNDDRGHYVGDQLLCQVTLRLSGAVREGDTVARLGGDEFVVMLENLSETQETAAAQAEVVAKNILGAMAQPYQIDGYLYHGSASLGVALFANNQDSMDDLLKRADLAMYQSKAAGRNTVSFFDPAMQAVVTARSVLQADMHTALLTQQFVLYYQPQVVGDGRITGVEALLRWQHPQRGLIPPMDFIALAEDTGLIVPLGSWVLSAACLQLVAWADVPAMADLRIAVNVSALQFKSPDFVTDVLNILVQTGARPQRLKLELTESLLINNVEDTISKMNQLKARGIGFSLDDFGTGYSSLSYLKRLPLEQLKIDKGFVQNILTEPNDAAIARMVTVLAESMGLQVIAEGVETLAQRDFLASLGCLAYQGYLYGRPMPIAEFEKLAEENQPLAQ